jgi:hypothetical protein
LTAFLLCGLARAVPAQAVDRSPIEAKVKVAMIYNLVKFVEWPDNVFPDPQSSFVISVLGAASFKEALSSLQGKPIKNHVITIRQITRIEDLGTCQVLVVGEGFREHLPAIREKALQKGMFTISDMPGFAESGGMIEFLVNEGKVRFTVNHAAMKAARLVISSQVLKLSYAVID